MSFELIDGKHVSNSIREEIKERVSNLLNEHSRVPGLAAVLVGDNAASERC